MNRGAKQVAVTSLSFPSNDVNKFIVGSEECAAYQVASCSADIVFTSCVVSPPGAAPWQQAWSDSSV